MKSLILNKIYLFSFLAAISQLSSTVFAQTGEVIADGTVVRLKKNLTAENGATLLVYGGLAFGSKPVTKSRAVETNGSGYVYFADKEYYFCQITNLAKAKGANLLAGKTLLFKTTNWSLFRSYIYLVSQEGKTEAEVACFKESYDDVKRGQQVGYLQTIRLSPEDPRFTEALKLSLEIVPELTQDLSVEPVSTQKPE